MTICHDMENLSMTPTVKMKDNIGRLGNLRFKCRFGQPSINLIQFRPFIVHKTCVQEEILEEYTIQLPGCANLRNASR